MVLICNGLHTIVGVYEPMPHWQINSASVNGVPAHASKPLLTDILRTEVCRYKTDVYGIVVTFPLAQLGFTGVAVTDWQDIERLVTYSAVAGSQEDVRAT
jgi:beta-glucosidase